MCPVSGHRSEKPPGEEGAVRPPLASLSTHGLDVPLFSMLLGGSWRILLQARAWVVPTMCSVNLAGVWQLAEGAGSLGQHLRLPLWAEVGAGCRHSLPRFTCLPGGAVVAKAGVSSGRANPSEVPPLNCHCSLSAKRFPPLFPLRSFLCS